MTTLLCDCFGSPAARGLFVHLPCRDPDADGVPVVLPADCSTVRYTASDDLPDCVLLYTLPSRYCLPDVLADIACGFGVCRDFVHLAISYCRALNNPACYIW